MSEADERLVVMLEARIAEFEKRMAQAERRGTRTYNGLQGSSRRATRQMEADMVAASARVNQSLASISSGVGNFAKAFAGGLIAGGAVAALQAFATNARDAVRAVAELGDEARRAGVAVEAFQEWRYVAQQNRIGIDQMVDGLKELNLRADEFIQTGAGPAAEAFQRMGFDAAELSEKLKDPSALMLEIIGRLEGLDKAAQIRIADEVFGGTGGERFVELIEKGEAGLRAQVERAREIGVVMDEDMIAKAAELDAKFNEITSRLRTMWQTGVVGAAEFFGLIEDKAEEVAQDLEFVAADLERSTEAAIRSIGDQIPVLLDAGAEEAALALSDIVGEMETLVSEFRRGELQAGEFEKRLNDAVTRAGEALAAAQEINGVDLSDAVGAVGRVAGALQIAFDWARGLRGELDEIAGGGAGPGFEGSGRGSAPSVIVNKPGKDTPRPKSAPPGMGGVDWGAGSPARGGAGGGGGGSSRIEGLLAELQTEREILAAWYEESLALLQSATDAELEAVGGRHEALERLEAEHQERLRGIRDQGQTGALAMTESFFGAMATLTAAGGDRMAKAARVFAAAEALINVSRAQAQVLADPKLSFWQKLPAAAAIGAAGMRFVAAIRSGSSASTGGAAATPRDAATGGADGGGRDAGPARVMLDPIDPRALFTGQVLIDMASQLQKEFGNRGIILTVAQ